MKQAVAQAAVGQIKDGMVVGLGSGSTAALMIKVLLMQGVSAKGMISMPAFKGKIK